MSDKGKLNLRTEPKPDLDEAFKKLQSDLAGIFGGRQKPKRRSSDLSHGILYFVGGMVFGGILVGTIMLVVMAQ